MQVQRDEGLYDTYYDCVNAIRTYGAVIGDSSCGNHAERVCGHQMRLLSCLTVKIVEAQTHLKRCEETVCGPGTANGDTECFERRARWLNGLSSCESREAIESPLL